MNEQIILNFLRENIEVCLLAAILMGFVVNQFFSKKALFIAKRKELFAEVNQRSSHSTPIPALSAEFLYYRSVCLCRAHHDRYRILTYDWFYGPFDLYTIYVRIKGRFDGYFGQNQTTGSNRNCHSSAYKLRTYTNAPFRIFWDWRNNPNPWIFNLTWFYRVSSECL